MHRYVHLMVCIAAFFPVWGASAQDFTVGGFIYGDVDNPLGSGEGGVTISVVGPGGTFTTTSWGADQTVPGLWGVEGVPAGTYAVSAHKTGTCFRHLVFGQEQAPMPVVILVGNDQRAANESLEFVTAVTGGCDDGDPCTTDTCSAGVCTGTVIPDCSPDDPPDAPQPPSGGPSSGGAPPDAGQPLCSGLDQDGDRVTDCDDVCPETPIGELAGPAGCACSEKECDDGNPCTEDGCVGGRCTHVAIACVDGDACTTDRCIDGACINEPRDCDDGDDCTIDSCSGGRCTHAPLCADDESCAAGVCTTAQADPGCLQDDDCDDGAFCNGAEACLDGQCAPGAPPCSTDQTCAEASGSCGDFSPSGNQIVNDQPADESIQAPGLCGAGAAGSYAILMLGLMLMTRRRSSSR